MCGEMWYVAKRVVRCVCGMCGVMWYVWCDVVWCGGDKNMLYYRSKITPKR